MVKGRTPTTADSVRWQGLVHDKMQCLLHTFDGRPLSRSTQARRAQEAVKACECRRFDQLSGTGGDNELLLVRRSGLATTESRVAS